MEMNNQTPLEQALMEVMLEEFQDIPAEEEIQICVSEAFQKNYGRLRKRSGQHPVGRVRKTVKRGLLIAVIVTALATTALAFSDVRETVIRFFVHNHGNRYDFSFDPEQAATAPKSIEQVYEITYIPAGYELVSESIGLTGVSYYWYDKEHGDYIMFDQTVISGAGYVPDSDGSEPEERNISGYQVFCIRDEANKYYWTDNSYFYSLYCGNGITEDQMQKIFDSIRENTDAAIQ